MPLYIVKQDITKARVDAIVNPTNEKMIDCCNIDREIHKAAGVELDAECAKLAPLELGLAKITKGYNLGCRYIIHTVAPVWNGGKYGERALLKSCYTESLRLAKEFHCRSIAFPLLASGAYGYPKDQVLSYAVQTISEFLYDNEMDVYLCVFDRQSYELNQTLLSGLHTFIKEPTETTTLKYGSTPHTSPTSKGTAALPMSRSKRNREFLREYVGMLDKSFAELLFFYIDKSRMSDVECYKKANIDRRTFSKIKGNPQYRPSKQTAVAFAIALELDLHNTQRLLYSAGMTLSRSNVFDKIIRYFIRHEIYDVFEINEALFEFDQVLLGC